jgi:hypothetical protein
MKRRAVMATTSPIFQEVRFSNAAIGIYARRSVSHFQEEPPDHE